MPNNLAHEYPDNEDIIVENLNLLWEFLPKLIKMFAHIDERIQGYIS